jgi:beta-glucosidase
MQTPIDSLRGPARTVFLALAILCLAACADSSAPEQADETGVEQAASQAAEPEAEASPWPRLEPTRDAEVEAFVDELMADLSLERKIGQIIQAEIQHVSAEEIRRYGLGAVLNGGGSFPGTNDRASVADWTELSRELHAAALEAGGGDPAIPLLWGTDAVHGHNNVYGATVFPHNIGLGATRDAELVRDIAAATAEQVSATGIDWNFAPTLAVARDLRWGRAYESFSSDPELVTELGRAAVVGLQGEPGSGFLEPPKVIATAKHFVGDGGTFEGVDQGDTRLTEAELYDIHGVPYPAALEAGVQTVMASFSSWNGQKMHGHRYLLTDVLKGRMGFDGFVIGDWNGHGQLPGCTVADCLEAFEAGVDMFMVPEDWRAFYDNFLAHAREGRLSRARLDDAVRRILRVKVRAGLFDRGPTGAEALPDADAHAALARRAVRQSLVLLKNEGGVLPIDPGARVLVIGEAADDIGQQSGGWTLDWQGRANANDDFPNGQSIYAGLAEQVRAAGGEIRLGEEGGEGFEPDVVIAVYGEPPYAEGLGDLDTLEFQPGTREAVMMLERAREYDAPVVSVFISGRPLWVNPELNRSDAFVAAWLPGTAGGGVADVLLRSIEGSPRTDFSGRLPFDWPAQPTPDEGGALPALFERGFGLVYTDAGSVPALPEDAMAPMLDDVIPAEGDWMLFDGKATEPWSLFVQGNNNSAAPQVEPTDRRVQGDARRVTWAEGAPGTVSLAARPSVDLSGFLDDAAVLAYDVRPEAPITAQVTARLNCGFGCGSEPVDLTPLLADAALDEWREIRIDLACFDSGNADFSSVSFLELLSAVDTEISLARVRIERNAAVQADIDCSD